MAREQVEYPLQSETIGLALREQRRTLPDIRQFRRESAQRRQKMGEIRAILMDLDRQRRELADIDKVVGFIIKSEPDLRETDFDLLNKELRRLLGERREIVIKLQAGLQRSFKNIQRLEFIEQQIASKAQEEALFLDEHLLWIRSAKNMEIQDLKNLLPALNWLFSPSNWWQAAQSLLLSAKRQPGLWILGLVIPIVLIGLRRRAHRVLSRIARKVYSVKTDSFVLTLQAMALTVRAAFGWPLLLGLVGWQLGRLTPSQDFAIAAGAGLVTTALTLGGSLFIYEMCWKEGVAKVHFKWPESLRRAIQLSMRWFVPILVLMTFIFTAVQTRNHAAFIDSLGRLTLIILLLGYFVWAARVLGFSGEIFLTLKRRRKDGWLVRLRYIWYTLAAHCILAIFAMLFVMNSITSNGNVISHFSSPDARGIRRGPG